MSDTYYKNVLVRIKNLSEADDTLDVAEELGSHGAKVTVMQTVNRFSKTEFERLLPSVSAIEDGVVTVARDLLHRTVENRHIPVNDEMVTVGDPAVDVIGTAKDLKPDVVVIQQDDEHMIGSTAERVLQQAECDVWVVRS